MEEGAVMEKLNKPCVRD